MTDPISEALAAMIPDLADRHADHLRRNFADTIERNPLFEYRGAWDPYRHELATARSVATPLDHCRARRTEPATIDETQVARLALRSAEFDAAKFESKLRAKLPGLDKVEISYFASNGRIEIRAERDGVVVHVTQSPVFKVSSLGRPFYQFPALIYVDGKRTTEKAFKAASHA